MLASACRSSRSIQFTRGAAPVDARIVGPLANTRERLTASRKLAGARSRFDDGGRNGRTLTSAYPLALRPYFW